ncbi:hypothetical protein ILYODFUR_034695 [Ilyodon furcidens]|uniref:Uncharacterized protein n=1 Tax=Ilyodon furcidens TaxID=33524 RepID=A0ABV0T5Z0_9TELE
MFYFSTDIQLNLHFLNTSLGGKEHLIAGCWMISVDSHVICVGIQSTFVAGLATLFSAYYIFNLQYQEDAVCMLEFSQR